MYNTTNLTQSLLQYVGRANINLGDHHKGRNTQGQSKRDVVLGNRTKSVVSSDD